MNPGWEGGGPRCVGSRFHFHVDHSTTTRWRRQWHYATVVVEKLRTDAEAVGDGPSWQLGRAYPKVNGQAGNRKVERLPSGRQKGLEPGDWEKYDGKGRG